MSNDFKLWSYQQKVEWLMEQVKKGTVDVEELASQVETNKDNIETNTGDISDLKDANEDLDERVTALEEAPAPTGGLEIINVSVGEPSQMGEGYYDLTISADDKAKILANPQNYILAFAENHVGTAYAHFIGSMDAGTFGMDMKVYGFTFLGTFPAIHDIQLFVGDMDIYYEKTYQTVDADNAPYVRGETIETAPSDTHTLDLTSDQLIDIYHSPEGKTLKVQDLNYTVYLHYDGIANNTVYFSGTKPVSGASGKATFTITNVMGTLTQYYNY